MFHWQAHLANHPSARAIFRSAVNGFLCEVFPEKEPNASKLCGLSLRTDFACLRADGSAVRLHPSRCSEAQVSEGNLESWRSGATPLFVLDGIAASERRSSMPPPPPPPPPPLHRLPAAPRGVVTCFGTALANFAWSETDSDYLRFEKGARIIYQPKPVHVDDCGWEYGHVVDTATTGWFPPAYLKLDDVDEIQPHDSVSHVAGEDHMTDSSDDSSSHSSLSMGSSSGPSQARRARW